jgi:hypothetical protein
MIKTYFTTQAKSQISFQTTIVLFLKLQHNKNLRQTIKQVATVYP